MQNLFGEGALSASFIPVYARLRTERQDDEAVRVAGAVFTLLALLSSVLVLIGVTWSAELVALLTPGFTPATRAITTGLVRIMFPVSALLVLSAWCLGVLNSHRRFFLSYVSPAMWNLAIIGAVLFGPHTSLEDAARLVAWGAMVGSALQFLVQLPAVLSLVRGMKLDPALSDPHVRTVTRNFGPALMSRGVLQVSSFVDLQFATMLTAGSVAALGLAQSITLLPVTLFGTAITAAALPAMSSVSGDGDARSAALRTRLAANQRRIAFFIVPSAAAFLTCGDAIAAALYRSGRFTATDATWLWAILAGASLGLLASTAGAASTARPSSRCRTPATPLRFALVRVGVGMLLAYLLGIRLPGWLQHRRTLGHCGADTGRRYRRVERVRAAARRVAPADRRAATGAAAAAAAVGQCAGGGRSHLGGALAVARSRWRAAPHRGAGAAGGVRSHVRRRDHHGPASPRRPRCSTQCDAGVAGPPRGSCRRFRACLECQTPSPASSRTCPTPPGCTSGGTWTVACCTWARPRACGAACGATSPATTRRASRRGTS